MCSQRRGTDWLRILLYARLIYLLQRWSLKLARYLDSILAQAKQR